MSLGMFLTNSLSRSLVFSLNRFPVPHEKKHAEVESWE